MHVVQKRHPTTCILGLADDTVGDDEPSKVCAWYADKADHQQKTLGLKENFTKAAIFSHAGDLDCVPAHIPGSPHSEGGTLDCFKAVGTYFGKDDACSAQVGQGNHMAAEPTHGPHHPHRSPSPRRA